ncbi:MAG: hypothetical protein KJ955_04930 [Nanoarchaeota archaeon]|nr:hypothetical protein [Nanoarchaeota archaeon]
MSDLGQTIKEAFSGNEEWIPVYGAIKSINDAFHRRPSLFDNEIGLYMTLNALYQGCAVGVTILIANHAARSLIEMFSQ